MALYMLQEICEFVDIFQPQRLACGRKSTFSMYEARRKSHEKTVNRKQNPNIVNFTGAIQTNRCETCI